MPNNVGGQTKPKNTRNPHTPMPPHITYTDDDKKPTSSGNDMGFSIDYYKRSGTNSLTRAAFTALRRNVGNIVVFLAVRFR